MDEREWLAHRFEDRRTHLRAVAYRMLGSLIEADDAVQGTWLRLSRADPGGIDNLGGWLTTAVARECLDLLRSRKARREDSLAVHMPDPIVSRVDGLGPEEQALVADSVGLAMLVVLDTLGPTERLAFVLHDVFAVPFDEIAHIIGRSPAAARKLASRARRRVQAAAPVTDPDVGRQQEVVDAFLAAARDGDFGALVAVLDPDVVLRFEGRETSATVQGAFDVARQTLEFSSLTPYGRPALVNGAPGTVVIVKGQPFSVVGFTVSGGKIAAIDILADPDRLSLLDLALFDH